MLRRNRTENCNGAFRFANPTFFFSTFKAACTFRLSCPRISSRFRTVTGDGNFSKMDTRVNVTCISLRRDMIYRSIVCACSLMCAMWSARVRVDGRARV